MLYARFRYGDRGSYGILEGDQITPIAGDLFGDQRLKAAPKLGAERIPLSKATLLAPVARPGKILAAAVNYQSHAPSGSTVTRQDEPPSIPQLFLKPSSSVIGPGEAIILPEGARRVDAEGELVAVIGRECRSVS